MRFTSQNPSDSAQVSESTSSNYARRPQCRRRRRRPPPSPITSSTSLHSETPDSPTPANITENQFDSYSSLPTNSTSSSPSPSIPPIFLSVVVPLPIFRGLQGECPIAHLTLFNRLFPSNNSSLNLISRNFPITLLDDAALWYELAVEPHPSMPWDETKSAFLRAFRPPEFADRARTELVSLRQRDGESVTCYHLRMQWILKRWPDHGLPESLVRGLFVDGLREEFHDWVMPRKPETLEEAVRLAMDWEGARTVRKGRGVRCGFCEGKHGEKECEVRRRMKEEWIRRVRGEERIIDGERKDEEVGEEERLGRVVSTGSNGRRSQCQCLKHQCWKKYDRSGSAVTAKAANTNIGAAAAAAPVGAVSAE